MKRKSNSGRMRFSGAREKARSGLFSVPSVFDATDRPKIKESALEERVAALEEVHKKAVGALNKLGLKSMDDLMKLIAGLIHNQKIIIAKVDEGEEKETPLIIPVGMMPR